MAERKRRSNLEVEALRLVHDVVSREGRKIRAARRRRRWIQKELGRRCDLSQQTISQIERGDGATLSLAAWQRVALALELPFDLELGRDALEEPRDAGHLAMQELVLRVGRAAGRRQTFELPTKPADPARSTDVGQVDDAQRRLLLIECVNSFGDVGAATRSSDKKAVEAEGLAIALGHGEPYSVHVCWVVRDTRRNRELIRRYPELFASRFTGSSSAWLRALTAGGEPPARRGLLWSDVKATRLFAWRRLG